MEKRRIIIRFYSVIVIIKLITDMGKNTFTQTKSGIIMINIIIMWDIDALLLTCKLLDV